ncbi:helicase-related protein, partial [Methylobacterium radiotolerans]|uniref:helicase-related protein n=1 Tax=Methylobacterium radiotolerans TaxID=31998 RepID=UPI003F66B76D
HLLHFAMLTVAAYLFRDILCVLFLFFCNTRNAVRHLQASLTERGFSVVALSGELGQGERNAALQALRDGRARVCVATDVAARGIDLPSLSLVIHADLPHDAEVLQHRRARPAPTGRHTGNPARTAPPSPPRPPPAGAR